MPHIDGHELGIFATVTGMYSVTTGVLGKGWVKTLIHRQPVPAFSLALALTGLTLPIVVPPIRRKLGLPTNQYEADRTDIKVLYPNFD